MAQKKGQFDADSAVPEEKQQLELVSTASKPAGSPKQDPAELVGLALKTVYQETVEESIPDAFRDLLNKLD